MSEQSTTESTRHDIRKRRSMVGQAVYQLLGKTGALVGLAWILITGLLGVLAPLLANSYPVTWLVQDQAGQWVRQWPMLAYLTPIDVLLAASVLLIAGLAFCYRAGSKLFWVWLLPMCVLMLPAFLFHLISDHSELLTLYRADEKSVLSIVWWWLGKGIITLIALGFIAISIVKLIKHPSGWPSRPGWRW